MRPVVEIHMGLYAHGVPDTPAPISTGNPCRCWNWQVRVRASKNMPVDHS